MKKHLWLCALALGALALSACTNVARFNYTDSPGAMYKAANQLAKTVTVLPFTDQRSVRSDNRQPGEHGSFYWGLIPLVPYAYVEKDEPEKGSDFVSLGRFHFTPTADLTHAAAKSLAASGLFREVTQAQSADKAAGDYLFYGTIENTDYYGSIITYCVSVASPAFWVIGFPEGVSYNRLGVTFRLVDRRSGNEVWSKRFDREYSKVHWIYARIGQDTQNYAALMKQAMNESLVNLSATDL